MLDSMSLTDALSWRYATKKMDPTKVVPEEDVNAIVEAIRMAPTSSGTQPFELFVVTNPDIRARIRAAARDQSQITDGSHLLVFAAWDNYSAERIDDVVDQMEEARGAHEMLTQYYENLKAQYVPRDPSVNHDHAARQAYIALGFALMTAAAIRVDSTPMEGFSPEKVDDILGLREKGLKSVLLLPLGYREPENDWLYPMAKVRKTREELVHYIR